MKTKTKENIIFVGLYGLLVFSSLGAMVGTYAWFEYNSRIKAQFYGTAINRTGEMKVGLYSEEELPEASEHGLTKDGYYYWANEGLNHDTLNYFFTACGYASNKIFPLTSGEYITNNPFNLKSNPTYLVSNKNVKAKKHSYIYLPLVFATSSHGSENINIQLTEAKLECNSTLKEALRMHFDLKNYNFIFAPNYSDDGEDVVGGVLDLNKDGYVDYDENTMQEYIYGAVSNASYNTTVNPGEGAPLPMDQRNCFNGKHRQGTYSLSDDTILKTSQYLGKGSIISNRNVTYMESGFARANITIYAEGWASGLIDQVLGTEFNLDLNFAII